MTTTRRSLTQTQIPCTDGMDRRRSVGLWTAPTTGRVVLVAPPAETALLTPDQARALSQRLGELATAVEQQQAELARAARDLPTRRFGMA